MKRLLAIFIGVLSFIYFNCSSSGSNEESDTGAVDTGGDAGEIDTGGDIGEQDGNPEPPDFTMTYDGNGNTGGSVPTDTTLYEQGQTVTVLGNTGDLVKTGNSFTGWNTVADGSGTTYTQGQTFSMTAANVTLYAKWTANPTYAITYDGNGSTGGSAPTDSTLYEEGQTVTVLGNTGNLVMTDFNFSGWNTAADGNGTTYMPGQTFPMPAADVTLWAKWIWAGTVTDIDGNVYNTVTINGQLWMRENLKAIHLSNSDGISFVTGTSTLTTPAYSNYGDNAANADIYGRLYNWYAVNTGMLCPAGWHVPSQEEWVALITYLGGATVAGSHLKEAGNTHWLSDNTDADNSSGFTALPGGVHDGGGSNGLGSIGLFWSATVDHDTIAKLLQLASNSATASWNSIDMRNGFSVRCVK